MKTVVIIFNLVTLLVMVFIASYKGLDLRRWSSWLYGAISFFCGLAVGFSLSGTWPESVKVGAIFAFMVLFIGATMRWHKRRYEGMARSLLLQYGRPDDPSLFAKLVRSLLGKYR